MRTFLAIALITAASVLSGCGSGDCYTTSACSAPLPPPPVVRPAIAPAPVVPAPSVCNPCAGI